MLQTKYISCGPHGYREDFLSFSHFKSMGAIDTPDIASLHPWGLNVMIYVGDH